MSEVKYTHPLRIKKPRFVKMMDEIVALLEERAIRCDTNGIIDAPLTTGELQTMWLDWWKTGTRTRKGNPRKIPRWVPSNTQLPSILKRDGRILNLNPSRINGIKVSDKPAQWVLTERAHLYSNHHPEEPVVA